MFRSSLAIALLACPSVLSITTPPAHAAGPSGLVAHRAVYDLELKDASDRSGSLDRPTLATARIAAGLIAITLKTREIRLVNRETQRSPS